MYKQGQRIEQLQQEKEQLQQEKEQLQQEIQRLRRIALNESSSQTSKYVQPSYLLYVMQEKGQG